MTTGEYKSYTHSNLYRGPTFEPVIKPFIKVSGGETPKPIGRFTWQSNKAILFCFTLGFDSLAPVYREAELLATILTHQQ